MKNKFFLIILFFVCSFCNAQINLQCSGRDAHALYYVFFVNGFYRIDSVDTQPTQPIFIEDDAVAMKGISINKDIYSGSGDTIMYGCDQNGQYFYYNTTSNSWVTTLHYGGNTSAVNPGGTDQYIFNYDPLHLAVYRYDGTATGIPIVTGLPFTNRLADVACDNQGNFYLFDTGGHKITAYNPNGIPIDSFITTGNSVNGGGGFAILGSRVYYIDLSSPSEFLYEGIKTGNTINFSVIETLPPGVIAYDLAACPNAANPLTGIKNNISSDIRIYPNPCTDKLNITINNKELSEITLYDITSKILLQQKFINAVSLNIEQLANGIYFYEVRSKYNVITLGKVVKE